MVASAHAWRLSGRILARLQVRGGREPILVHRHVTVAKLSNKSAEEQTKRASEPNPQSPVNPLLGCGLVVQLTLVVVTATLGPLGIGILLDHLLHTSPFITLFTVVMGTAMGTIGIAREMNSFYSRVAGGKK